MMTLEEFWQENYAAQYAEALAKESERRSEAFLNVPRTVAGEDLRVMTAGDLHLLDGFGNAFVCTGMPTVGDLEMFLWTLNTQNRPGERFNGWRYYLFARRFRKMDMVDAAHQVFDYMEYIFSDSGYSRTVPSEKNIERQRLNTCFLAGLTVAICNGLGGIHPDDVRAMPLPQVFAYKKEISRAAGSATADISPSDKIKSDCLEAYNNYLLNQPVEAV